jgi:alpha-beta hydrolase superfamily lysophospholipase
VRALVLLVLAALAPAAAPPPSLTQACGTTPGFAARAAWLTTGDGVRLYSVEAGAGSTAVVLAHQGGGSLCGELPYARTLLASGVRVFAFDFRGWGHSESSRKHPLALGADLAAAVEHVRDEGAKHVFLVGASMGGAAVVQNSGGLPVAGVVSLSGTRLWPGFGVNRPGPAALRAPFLYLGGRDDGRAPLAEARSIFRRAGSHDKRAVYYPGGWHGWELVQDAPFAAKTRALILAWIRARD